MVAATMRLQSPAGGQCGYVKCTNSSTTHLEVSLKACAACGVISYCSKDCQKSDWRCHKPLCLDCRPFHTFSSHLSQAQKTVLNKYSMLKLPSIDEEYRRKYPAAPLVHHMWVKGGLDATKSMMLSNLRNLSGDDTNIEDLAKRWQEVSPNLSEFLRTAKVGDIFHKKKYMPYNPGAPQQFRNTPLAVPAKLKNGKTYVDIGFVDFGITFDSINTLEMEGNPLIVVVFEAEPQCAAKSMIMIEMMKDTQVMAQSVVEVWLSSLWSKTTLQAFKKATHHLLHGITEMDPKVRAIIEFWNDAPKISLKAALDFQIKAIVEQRDTDFAMMCCSLESETDRVSFLRYFFTKALYEDQTTTLGSIVMGRSNDSIGVKQLFENCMEAAPSSVHYPFHSHYFAGRSVMERVKLYFEEKTKTYMNHIRNGTLVFTPKLGCVSSENQQLVDEIKEMRPYVISWSNVVDYISPKSFHAIAKQMSGPETVHILHSCNWTTRVYGTDVFDINVESRLHFYSAGLFLMESSHGMSEGFSKHSPYHF